jgi:hypothetical protein
MASSDGLFDFSFDDGKVIKSSSVEKFVQNKNDIHRVSIVSFKTHHEAYEGQKAREKGSPLTDKEKAELFASIDEKLLKKLGKKELSETDKLDISKPKFWATHTHYKDGIGLIRCLSEYQGTNLVKPEICCQHIGEADQSVATVIMTYPVEEDMSVDKEIFGAKKQIKFLVWRLNPKKYRKVESTYRAAREDSIPAIDMKVTLDGDPKYQKQLIERQSAAFWAKEEVDSAVRVYCLEQAMRVKKHIEDHLGFKMKKEMLSERLNLSGSSSSSEDESPKIQQSYSALLDD